MVAITSSDFAVLRSSCVLLQLVTEAEKVSKVEIACLGSLKKIINTNNFGSYSNTFYMFVPTFALTSGITTKEHCAEGRHPYRFVFCVISQVGA